MNYLSEVELSNYVIPDLGTISTKDAKEKPESKSLPK